MKAFLTLVLIVLSLPVFLILSIIVLVVDGRPIIFKQKRTGFRGKIFTMYKFRSMCVGAENQQNKLKDLNEADGPVFKIRNDPRFSPLGKFLSHSGLDELPQLFNVLKGDMNLVGPRPLPVEEEKKIAEKYRLKRQSVMPGIISLWIINGHHRMGFEEWMKNDMEYIDKKSKIYDLGLVVKGGFLFIKLILIECTKRLWREKG